MAISHCCEGLLPPSDAHYSFTLINEWFVGSTSSSLMYNISPKHVPKYTIYIYMLGGGMLFKKIKLGFQLYKNTFFNESRDRPVQNLYHHH